jgi:hypothetical protein
MSDSIVLPPDDQPNAYEPPRLEPLASFSTVTGVSLPIGNWIDDLEDTL